MSPGRADVYFNKYSERFGCSMMDFYITDSLQDMLDIDIKSEMATDLGSSADFSDTLGVSFSDLPPLLDIDMDNATTWIAGSHSNSHNSSNFVHNLDLYGSEANAVMVNPNSVMPSMFSESPNKKSASSDQESSNIMLNSVSSDSISRSSSPPSPIENKNNINFSNSIQHSKLTMKVEMEDLDDESNDSSFLGVDSSESNYIIIKKEEPDIKEEPIDHEEEIINLPKTVIPNIKIKTSQPEIFKINSKNLSILNSNQGLTTAQYIKSQSGTQTIISGNIHILGHQQSRALLTNGNKTPATILIDNGTLNNNNRQVLKSTTVPATTFSDNSTTKYVSANKNSFCAEFPKPAYSYSCLIAMALKNSRTGSLPVAEIYNFMCQHFPYFKTAPNGWKNSVRHNLSLNKCFEKIEKPSTNGGQRKGCLWAMNPSKVVKMDEEVQKWSRKDPQAIRKAMVRPDSLEALERGEMKFCSESNGGDDYGSEEEELDVDEAYLVSTSPAGSPAYIQQYDDETSDVEVMEGVEIEDSKPLMLEFSLASQFHTESPAKRPKTNYIYHTVNATTAHANRRKAPLINRIG